MLVTYSFEGGARGDYQPDSGARDNLNFTHKHNLGRSGFPLNPTFLILHLQSYRSEFIRPCLRRKQYCAGCNGVLAYFAITCNTKEGSTLNKESRLDELKELCGRIAYEKKISTMFEMRDRTDKERDWLQEIAYHTQNSH
jgi:hypothetical protein